MAHQSVLYVLNQLIGAYVIIWTFCGPLDVPYVILLRLWKEKQWMVHIILKLYKQNTQKVLQINENLGT